MLRSILSIVVAFAALSSFAEDPAKTPFPSPAPAKDTRFFEMRIYHAAPGKLDALQARFRNFTNKLMVKHGMEIVGFWAPVNKDGQSQNSLVCILGFPSRAARDRDWKEFSEDLEWLAVKSDTEKSGKLIEKVDTYYMNPSECSPTNSPPEHVP